MAIVKIETYRGYEIEFNTTTETFLCDVGDTGKEKNSYAAIKKVIDDYKKENDEFTPIEVFSIGGAFSGGSSGKIIGLRKDGRFVIEKNGKKEQLSDYQWREYYLAEGVNEKPKELDSLKTVYLEARKAYEDCENKYRALLKEKYPITPVLQQILKDNNQ